MSRDKEGGLAPWAVMAMGFDLMCRCGHEEGFHGWIPRATEPYACDVIDCDCKAFWPAGTGWQKAPTANK